MAYPKTETGVHLDNTDRLVGRDTAGAGAGEEITVGGGIEFTGSGGIQTSAFTGDVTKAAGGTATTIAANAVEYSMIQDFGARGNILRGGASGAPEEHVAVTAGQVVMGDGTDVLSQAISGDATLAGTGALTIADGAVDGGKLATHAADATTAGAMVVHHVAIAGGDTGADHDVTLDDQITVTGVKVIRKAAGGTAALTVTVKSTGNAITDAIDIATGGDKTVYSETTIDDAYNIIPAAGVLRVTSAAGAADFPACDVYVTGFRSAP